MEQQQFKIYDDVQGFRPLAVSSYIPTLERNQRIQANAEQEALNQLRENNRVRQKNAQLAGKDLIALSNLSKTLFSAAEQHYKKSLEDKEVDETYRALMGDVNPLEDQQQQIADDEAAENAELTNTVANDVEESTGDIAASEAIRIDYGSAGRGFAGEKAALMKAQVAYSPFMAAWMASNNVITTQNGQEITVQDAIRSGDSRLIQGAVAVGRRTFIKQYGLQRASKRQFVKMMANTIINADAQVSGAAVREGIKANRDEVKSVLTGQGYEIGQTVTPSNVPQSYRDLADTMWKSGVYKSRGAANEAALDSIIDGMTDRGDVDGLRQLLTTEKIEGNPGTQLRSQYGNKINDAIVKAEGRQETIINKGIEEIESSMYQRLGYIEDDSPNAIEQRDLIIEDTAKQYEQIGEYKKARELRSQRDNLTVAGNSQRVNAELEQQINDGVIVDAKPINDAYSLGSISRDQRNKRIAQLNAKTDSGKVPSSPIATKLINSYTRRWVEESGRAFGLKADQFGNYVDSLANETTIISPGDAAVLKGQVEAELRTISNQLLRENPGISDQELQRELTKRLQEWWTKETQSAGGAYRIDDVIKSRQEQAQAPTKDFSQFEARFKNSINNLDERVSGRSGRDDSPKDFSHRSQVDTVRREDFNPLRMDILFNKTTTKQFADTYQSSGVINKDIVRMADKLGMTPMALLQQQLAANGLEPVKPPVRSRQSSTTPLTSVQGAQKLMSYGFPVRGASWLSGNIAQESSWIGNREPWQDGANKAGGLVSWNGPRLAAIQQRFGRPISEITTEQQLQYMVEELKQPQYAEANRIFRNPYSTDRQLIRASKIYWGYGEEGNRYQYSRDIERQLKRSGSIQNQGGKVYQPQASSVPYINQRTAINGAGDRQCFSAVSTMVANGYGVSISYDDYNNIRSRYGDTTVSSAQTGALRSLGLNASVSDNGSVNELARLAQSGKPVGIGIQPGSGSGHWIAVVGLTPQGDFIVNDPYGQLVQQKGGGWKYRNSTAKGYGGNAGENVIYSREFLASVWVDRGAGTGRILRIS